MRLYHFTCNHGHEALTLDPCVRPLAARLEPHQLAEAVRYGPPDLLALLPFAWFTDLDEPVGDALGLTRYWIGCDRTAHRWRVAAVVEPVPWTVLRVGIPRLVRAQLEAAPGALPRHWYVSKRPVPVEHDPTRAELAASRMRA